MNAIDFAALVNASFATAAEKEEAARRAAFGKARNNVERLIALGVIVSCDDEHDAAQAYYGRQEIAKQAGVSFDLVNRAADWSRAAYAIIAEWKSIGYRGETQEEAHARFVEAVSALPVAFEKGAKKPCKHNSTQSKRGFQNIGNGVSICCRCGSRVEIPYVRPVPTAAAVEAAALYAQFGNEE